MPTSFSINIAEAAELIKDVCIQTPLQLNALLSERYEANIYLKREDLQVVRSYKIRGAYNKIASLSEEEMANGVICASAGNHAQGVAYSCMLLKIFGTVFMPSNTPSQKIERVKKWGGEWIEIFLAGVLNANVAKKNGIL